MKTPFALVLLSLWMVAAKAASYTAPPIHDTLAALTNSTAYAWQPFAFAYPATNEAPLIYSYEPASSATVSSPFVLPSKSGGRWIASRIPFFRLEAMPQATNAVLTALQGLTNGTAGQVIAATGPGTFTLTNAASGGGTNRYVEQSINATNSPIAINGAAETTYVFTGAQDSSTPRYYYLPTNNVPLGALLHIVLQGTNVWTHWPLQYYFVDPISSATNRIYDNNRLDFTWSGTRWVKHGLSDWILPPGSDGLFYGWFNGGPQQIPIQGDAPFDGLEYVRKNQAWAVASGGGGGGGTNHNALTGLQGGAVGEYFHLSSNQNVALTGSGDTTLHYHASDRNRANHTGSQLIATISDWATNVWTRITSILQRGSGVHFATNTGANTLTISGWYLPGANVTFTTNGDSSITVAAASSGSTNGTPLTVNGGSVLSLANLTNLAYSIWAVSGSNVTLTITNLPQSAVANLVADLASKQAGNSNLLQIATAAGNPGDILYRHASGVLTNLPVGSSGHVLTVASGAPAWQAASGGGGGGAGTNFWLNGVLQQPARITNSTTVTWSTNANGDVIATAQGANATYTTNRVDVPIFTSVDAVTVPDTTTNETSLVGTLKSGQSKMLAANALANGTIIRVRANGTLSASGDWSNGAFRVRIGGRVLTAQLYEPDSLTPSNLPWELTAYLAVTAAGSSASNTAVGVLSYGHGSAGSVGANMLNMVASGTLNTTVTNAVDVTFENDGAQPVTLACRVVEAYELAEEFITGGSGQFFAEGQLVQNPNLIAGAGLTNTISGTNITIALAGHTPISGARSGFRVWDDLLSSSTTQGDAGTVGVNNSGSVNVTAGEPGRPGIKFVRTTGANQMPVWSWRTADMMRMTNAAGLERWRFECGLKVPATLSGAANTDQYSLRAGFSTLPNTTNTPTDSVAFVHQTNLLGSVNWAFQTINNSTATTTDTGVAVTASTWYDLIADLTPTNAIATINGVAVATNTVGIPLSRQMGVGVQQQRYSGGTTIDCLIDYLSLSYSGTLR